MAKLTRRGFIGQTTASVATIGILATVPTLAATPEMTDAVTSDAAATELSCHHIFRTRCSPRERPCFWRSHYHGLDQRGILRDTDLVMRLLKAIH